MWFRILGTEIDIDRYISTLYDYLFLYIYFELLFFFISSGEEPKLELEPNKILGTLSDNKDKFIHADFKTRYNFNNFQ